MGIFKNLKKALDDIENATTLKLSVKGSELPCELYQLRNLEALYIQSKELENVGTKIRELTNLTTLYISSKPLSSVPEEVLLLPNLINLSLTGCRVLEFKLSIGKKTIVKNLQLNKNDLSQLPKNLEHIESLQSLNLADNSLSEFKLNLANLIELKMLNLDRNGLESIPTEIIMKMKSLNSISLDGNKFSEEEKAKITSELGYWFGEI